MSQNRQATLCSICKQPFRRWVRYGDGTEKDYWCENCDAHGRGCTRQHPPGGLCEYPHPRAEDQATPMTLKQRVAWLEAEIKTRETTGEPATALLEELIMLRRRLEGGGETVG